MFDEFNPDSTVRLLPVISVLKKDGSEIAIDNRIVELDAGASFDITIDADTDDIVLGAATESNLYHQQKYEALRDRLPGGTPSGPFEDPASGVTPEGEAWSFTDDAYYISRLAAISPEEETGVVFMASDSCSNYIQGVNLLTLIDICGPCIDCPTYATLQTYLERIDELVQYVWQLTGDKDTSTIPTPPSEVTGESFTGVYLQSLAALNYWNYLVHKQSVKAHAQSFGQSVSAASFYRNISAESVGPINIEIKFRFMQRVGGGSLSPWNGINAGNTETRVIAREGVTSATLSSGPLYSANEVTMNLDAGTLLTGEDVYGDAVLMITDTGLFDVASDQILIIAETTFSVTHIGNNIVLTDTIYFRASDEPPEE
jgi:hypothetical protein